MYQQLGEDLEEWRMRVQTPPAPTAPPQPPLPHLSPCCLPSPCCPSLAPCCPSPITTCLLASGVLSLSEPPAQALG